MKIKIIIVLTILSNIAFGQFEDKSELKKVTSEMILKIKKYSLVKDSADWDELNREVLKDIDNLPLDSSKYIISEILNVLKKYGDNHSFYMTKVEASQDNSFSYNENIAMPGSQLLENNIAYLHLPAHKCMNSELNYLYADTLISQIRELDENHNIKGWIIDLRQNRGGNMWPMLAGLSPFFYGKMIGYFASDKNDINFKIKAKSIPSFKSLVNKYECRSFNHKIAVLIDTLTASSGEMTAICLLGLNNTKSFGLRSAGCTTMLHTFKLVNGSLFLLATEFFMDGNNKIYKDAIQPNVIADKNIIFQKAINWIYE
ncbi:MAG: hypothetical protein C0594_15435 [Marinilabiliales bacterium]|nr:MAG: hypothetical protein C0594_15435 [Marinilabiliales bacterium]